VEVVGPKYDVISYHQVRSVTRLLCDCCVTVVTCWAEGAGGGPHSGGGGAQV
jgi:hypothetical protein